MTRHLLRDDDLSPAEQAEILDLAVELKKDRWADKSLSGPQTVAVIFDKSSTRTRVSFAVGIADLGGSPLIISTANSQLGGKETPADTARVLERQVAAIVWRTYAQAGLEEMAAGTRVPVVNALSDDFHPCQLLADLLTIKEHKGELKGLTLAFFGDGRSNMAHSYVLACVTAGMHVRVASPESYAPREDVISDADAIAAATGGSVALYTDGLEAAAGADVVVTDTWVSMGKEEEKLQRLRDLGAVQGHPGAHVARAPGCHLHPLPSGRPRVRGRRRGHRRPAERRLGRGGEPAARPEGAAGVVAAPAVSGEPPRARRVPRPASLASRWERLNGPHRVAGIDLARGLAVIGMFAAHLLWIPPFEWADAGTWHDVVNGRSSILFATLAGVSIGLVTGRTAPFRGEALGLARRRLAVRAVLVWVLGIALITLDVPVYVILPAYAVLFLLVLPLLRLPAAWLFGLAAALAVTMPFLQFVIAGWTFWATPAGWLIDIAIGGHYPFLVWSAFVVAGLGMGRLPLTRPRTAAALLGIGAVLAVAGYSLGATTAGLRAREPESLWAFVSSAEAHTSGIGEVVGSGGFAIAVVGLCVLLTTTPLTWLVLPLRAVGAMALTAYSGQLVAWALLQPTPPPGETDLSAFRALEPFWPFAIWTVILCTAWGLLVGRGPIEWAIDRMVRWIAPDSLGRP